jgi:hypothetical protein
MNRKNDNEKLLSNEPNVPCPTKFESPFLQAANAIESQHDELKKILIKVEGLISEQKIEELRNAGKELLRIVETRASSHNEDCRTQDSYFQFTANRQTYQSYGQSRREPTWHTIPFLGDVTDEDVAIYSALTRKSQENAPLRIAQALVNPQFNWRFALSQIQEIVKPIPSTPEIPVKLPQIGVDEKRRLVIGGRNDNSAFELDENWRERGHPICKAVRESGDDKLWSQESVQADLVRCDDKYVWLSTEEPSKAALLCPRLVRLKDHFEEVGECLKLWRKSLGKPDDFSVRLKSWRESKPNAATWIAHIAEVILANFSPWPDPFRLRAENDSERDWSPEQCLKQVLPLFRGLARASLRATPPNLVKTFLYLIRRPNVDAHAYAGEFSDMWNFSVRTYDHSWINGEIIGSSTLGVNSPLKFEEIGSGYGGAEGYCISCTGIDCFISEERNQRR